MAKTSEPKADGSDPVADKPIRISTVARSSDPATKYVVTVTQFGPHKEGKELTPADLPEDADFDRFLELGILKRKTVTVDA